MTEDNDELERAEEDAEAKADAEPDVEDAEVEVDEASEDTEVDEAEEAGTELDTATPESGRRGISWALVAVFGVLAALLLLLVGAAGYLKWQDSSARNFDTAGAAAMAAAQDTVAKMLTYEPEKVDEQLAAARELLTDGFRQEYTELTNDVVIPAAKEQQVTARATVPAVATVSATANHAVVLAFVNQNVSIGEGAPSDTASSVRVTLDKVDGRWLISAFEPV